MTYDTVLRYYTNLVSMYSCLRNQLRVLKIELVLLPINYLIMRNN